MPTTIVSASATSNFLMTVPRSSVNFRRTGQRLLQLLQRKRFTAGDLQNRCLAAAAEFGGIRQLRGHVERNDNGAVPVGMNEIAGTNCHTRDANLTAKAVGVDVGMRRADHAGQRLEARRPLRDVADRS